MGRGSGACTQQGVQEAGNKSKRQEQVGHLVRAKLANILQLGFMVQQNMVVLEKRRAYSWLVAHTTNNRGP